MGVSGLDKAELDRTVLDRAWQDTAGHGRTSWDWTRQGMAGQVRAGLNSIITYYHYSLPLPPLATSTYEYCYYY